MDRFAYTSLASITESALKRQSLVNDLANVSTVGFKRSFDAALRGVRADGAGFESRIQPQTLAVDVIDLNPGPLQVTGNKMDITMQDQSVLGVIAADGSNAFTRRGDLRVNASGVLETGSGQIVRGEGGPITLPQGVTVSFSSDGSVLTTNPATGEQAVLDRLYLRDASETQLVRREDGLFTPRGDEGGDIAPTTKLPGVISGALEGSNVSAIESMVMLMDQSRSFEMSMNAIKESKDLDANGASMLRLG